MTSMTSAKQVPKIFAGIADADIEYAEFELVDPEESDSTLVSWLGALPKDGSRVVVFAQDGMGSLFALWLRANHAEIESAPVIYLGSEGETAVLAKDPRAFVELLGSAVTFDGHAGTFFSMDEDEDEEVGERRERSRSFAKRTLGLDKLRKPAAIKAEAEAAYPDLQAWVDANNAHS